MKITELKQKLPEFTANISNICPTTNQEFALINELKASVVVISQLLKQLEAAREVIEEFAKDKNWEGTGYGCVFLGEDRSREFLEKYKE